MRRERTGLTPPCAVPQPSASVGSAWACALRDLQASIRAKSGLNKSILDQGRFEFRRQLDYKLAWNGWHLIAVPPQSTSRTCPCCGHVSKNDRQTRVKFGCGFEENADVVGAINVLRAGHARLACEVSGAVMPPAAGTQRGDSGAAQCRA